MAGKKYSSYADIQRDLEILSLERKIYYRKALLSVSKTRDSILPTRSISYVADLYNSVFSGTKGTLVKMLIPFVINWIIKRKRGN